MNTKVYYIYTILFIIIKFVYFLLLYSYRKRSNIKTNTTRLDTHTIPLRNITQHYLTRDTNTRPRDISDRYVIIGSHYDAWVFGAVDPGLATLLETARVFAQLRKSGSDNPIPPPSSHTYL